MRNIRVFIEFAPLLLCLAIGLVIGLSFAFNSSGSTAAVSAAPTPVPTPTPQTVNGTARVTPTLTVAWVQEPIIGGWRYGYTTGYNDIYFFRGDGNYVENFYDIYTGKTDVYVGTWHAQGNNSYLTVEKETNNSQIFIYSSIENGIFSTEHPTILLTPYHGSVKTPFMPIEI
jgi:hypothetical protein